MALKKTLNPIYKFSVEIPVPGEKPEKVEFKFKYRTESQLKKHIEDNPDQLISGFMAEFIDSWGLDEVFGEFSLEALKELADVYPGALNAIHVAFYKSRLQGRVGN